MSWIKTVDPDSADGALKEMYAEIFNKRGKIANVMQVHSLNPASLRLHIDLYEQIMFGKSGLSREERELTAVMVSAANKCSYCIVHHGEALNQYWQNEEKLVRLVDNFKFAGLPSRQKALVEYAVKLTSTPHKVTQDDIETLRNHDLSDEDILDLDLIISYMNFANRIISGLGVQFDPEEAQGYKY